MDINIESRFTQIVRVRSVSHRISQMYGAKKSHRFHSAEIYSHRFHRFTQIVRVRSVSHRISQMYGAKKSHRFHSAEIYSHRFHRFTQIVRVRSVSHRIHRIHRSMVQKKSHRFHRARRSLSLKHLCNSVKSVGVYLIRSFCEFGVFRGSTSH